jgi:hypothetical protein
MSSLESILGRPSKPKKESEKVVERYLATEMERLGGLCFKWVSPSNRGVPDRICIFPSSKIALVECKSEGCKMSKMQLVMKQRLSDKCAIHVYLIDTKKEVDLFINQHTEEFTKL